MKPVDFTFFPIRNAQLCIGTLKCGNSIRIQIDLKVVALYEKLMFWSFPIKSPKLSGETEL